MSEKEFSNGNSPHVPVEQADETELLPADNEAEGHEAELQPAEAEPSPPEGEAEGHEAELQPAETEQSPPENEAKAHEAELHSAESESSPLLIDDAVAENIETEPNPVEAESSPPKGDDAGKAESQKLPYHSIEAILARCRNNSSEAEGREVERRPVKTKSPSKKKGTGKAEQKPTFHPYEVIFQSRNNDAEETEACGELHPTETESKDSDRGSPLEGGVEGVIHCDCGDIHFSSCPERPIQAGKEDIFRKFFSNEYDQPMAPIQGRQRHSAQVQRPRRRHVSEDSRLSDQNLLGCLQDVGTSGGAVLNQAGAIIGKYIPKEAIPDYARFGTEFGQSLPVVPTTEGCERSIGSVSTSRIGEIYGGTFSVISDLSFPSFSSRPPTATSGNLETSPPDSSSPEDKQQLPVTADSMAHEMPVPRRTSGIVIKPEKRSKSAFARLSTDAVDLQDSELREGKLSSERSVRSEPLPQRKISQDSSTNSSEQISLDDETHYTELCHSSESDSCLPVPDTDAAVDSLEDNLGSLKVSDIESATTVQNVALKETDASEKAEQDPVTKSSSSGAGGSLKQTEASEKAEPVTAQSFISEARVCLDQTEANKNIDPATAENSSTEAEGSEPTV